MFDYTADRFNPPTEWKKIALDAVQSLADYTMAMITDPRQSSTARHYETWGFDEWLIREKRQSFAGLMALNKGAYTNFILNRHVVAAGSLGAFFEGKPMVQTTVYRPGVHLFMQAMPKHSLGIVLHETPEVRTIYIPSAGNAASTPHVVEYLRTDTNFIEHGIFSFDLFERLANANGYSTVFIEGRFYCHDTTGEVVFIKKSYPNSKTQDDDGYLCATLPARPKQKKAKGYMVDKKAQAEHRHMSFNEWKVLI